MAKRNRNEPLPYYKWLWRDWRSNRRVQRMSKQARAIYRELLDEFWAEGVIPCAPEELAEICGWSMEEVNEFWPEIEPCWEKTPDGYINRKMEEQRTETDSQRAVNARNARTAALERLANASERSANASAEAANASERHIAEQSREEKRREEQKPSRDKREGKVSDPRHTPCKLAVEAYCKHKDVLFLWDPSAAKQLDLLLKAGPGVTEDIFKKCLNNRAKSVGTTHGEHPRVWLQHVLRYQQGPLNEFGRTDEKPATNQRGSPTLDNTKTLLEKEQQERNTEVEYWRKLRDAGDAGDPSYETEAPVWVKRILEAA